MQDLQEQTTKTSLSGRVWQQRYYSERDITNLSQKYGISEILAKIILSKEINIEAVESYLTPKIKDLLPNPFILKDMKEAVERILTAIYSKEKIVIFGDYDVDGATSTALFIRFFRDIGIEADYYIPDRILEGYGPNLEALRKIRNNGGNLVITVDCGTLAIDVLEQASKEGLDIIVVDHHLSDVKLPKICAVINPNRIDESSEYKYLAAVGVAFLVIIAVNMQLKKQNYYNNNEPNLISYLDIVALGTVCDVVPLIGLNRAFVTQGLKILANWQNQGLAAVASVAKINGVPSEYHLGYVIGPRINAGGRVGESHLGTVLLSTKNVNLAQNIAEELDNYNQERKLIEQNVIKEALMQAAGINDDVIVVANENWHQGVIGIVAGRLKEKYNKPVAVISLDGDKGKASCRSIKGFDFGAAIINAKLNNIILEGGGHAMAAGFSINKEKINELKNYLNNEYSKNQHIIKQLNVNYFDSEIISESVNLKMAKEIAKIAPFGNSNFEPRFSINDVTIHKIDVIAGEHLKLLIRADKNLNLSNMITATAFRVLEHPLGDYLLNNKNNKIDLIGYIRINNWRGIEKVEFIIEDVIIPG